jgi:glutamyl-tRNA synthetase
MVEAGFQVSAADLAPIVPLIQERLKTLAEVVERTDFFFQEELDYDPSLLIGKKMTAEESWTALRRVGQALADLPDFEAETTHEQMRALAAELELKAGQLFGIVRVAVTGKKVAPPLFETMAILGQETSLYRIEQGIRTLSSLAV